MNYALNVTRDVGPNVPLNWRVWNHFVSREGLTP